MDHSTVMSAHQWRGRYLILVFDFALVLGIYYCVDLPSGMQADLQGQKGNCSNDDASSTSSHGNSSSTCCEECLGLGPDRYNQLYSVISWTNAVLVFPAGVFIDRFGNRVSSLLVTGSATCGAVLFAMSTLEGIKGTSHMFVLMMVGRLLLATGNGPARIVQDRVIAMWFPDKLALVFGLIVTGLRLGNVLNFLLTPNVATRYSVSAAMWLGAMFCGSCFLASIGLSIVDWYGNRRINQDADRTSGRKTDRMRFQDIRSFPLSFWLVCMMLATYYSFLVPYVANGSKFLQDKYGYDKTISSYINGALYDVAIVMCPVAGQIMDKFGFRAVIATCGSLLTIPLLLLILWTAVNPIVINVCIGILYTWPVIALWPCIAVILPLKVVGTGNGLAAFMLHVSLGATTFGVGKILGAEEEQDDNKRRQNWTYMYMVLIGHLVVCTICGLALNVTDKRHGSKLNTPRHKWTKVVPGIVQQTTRSSEEEPLIKDSGDQIQ